MFFWIGLPISMLKVYKRCISRMSRVRWALSLSVSTYKVDSVVPFMISSCTYIVALSHRLLIIARPTRVLFPTPRLILSFSWTYSAWRSNGIHLPVCRRSRSFLDFQNLTTQRHFPLSPRLTTRSRNILHLRASSNARPFDAYCLLGTYRLLKTYTDIRTDTDLYLDYENSISTSPCHPLMVLTRLPVSPSLKPLASRSNSLLAWQAMWRPKLKGLQRGFSLSTSTDLWR